MIVHKPKTRTRKIKRTDFIQNPVLRQHQDDALDAIKKVIRKGEGKGKIVLPTGTGKTRIEAETVCLIEKHLNKEGLAAGVYVVMSPRILLAYQQLDEFLTILGRNWVACDYMVVNSGGLDSAKYEKKLLQMGFDNPEEIDSTTTTSSIVKNIQNAQKKNLPLVIFSTYHSVGRVDAAARESNTKITAYLFDEAQYCVSAGDFQHVPNFEAWFHFFYTATEKLTGASDGLGMDNEDKFGKILFTEKPKTLIERGEMTSIALHLVGTRGETIADDDYESMAKVVVDAFDKHRQVMQGRSFAPETIGPKMIVVCNKQDALRGIMRSKALKSYKLAHQNVNLCALSSDFGIEVNGEITPRASNKNKEVLLSKMRSWSSESEAIVLHVDMIAEGLDVPGITAVMPFRGLEKIKFLQNTGRGTRLIDADRRRLYSGEIRPKDWVKYVKPFCWLILPVLSSEYYDQKRRYTRWIEALRNDYGFTSSELVIIDNIVGPPEPKALEDIVGVKPRVFSTGAGLIGEIVHGIEEGEAMTEFMENVFAFNTLSQEKQIAMLKEIYA